MHFLELAVPFQKIGKVIKSALRKRDIQMDFLTLAPPAHSMLKGQAFKNLTLKKKWNKWI